jgi:CheY-like chemotaxis protein
VKNINEGDRLKKLEPAKSVTAPADIPNKSEHRAAHRGRLLIVEDSESSRAMICNHLREENFDFDEADNGAIAVEKVKVNRYSLILMDIKMPMMDGHEAMRRIRQWEEARGLTRTPIIAFTASSFEEDVQQAIQSGADLHVSKPVKKEALAAAIKSLVLTEAADGDAPLKHSVG